MSTDTITTATQNLVIAFNSLNKTQQYLGGQFTSLTYPDAGAAKVQIYTGKSRIVSVTIIIEGGTVEVYDTASIDIIPAASLIYTLDSTATIGVYQVGAECKNGIVLVVTDPTHANITFSVF
jgi:hypothetical protein